METMSNLSQCDEKLLRSFFKRNSGTVGQNACQPSAGQRRPPLPGQEIAVEPTASPGIGSPHPAPFIRLLHGTPRHADPAIPTMDTRDGRTTYTRDWGCNRHHGVQDSSRLYQLQRAHPEHLCLGEGCGNLILSFNKC